MKVLHLIDSEGLFGAEHVLLNLLPALQTLNVKLTLGCMSPIDSAGADIGRELEKYGTPVIFLNEKNKVSINGLLAIYRAIRQSRADILHAHGYKATILGGFISLLMGVPFVVTYHGEAKQRPELSGYMKIEAILLRRASHIIAVSNNIRSELIERGINDNSVSVIYNGIRDPIKNANNLKTGLSGKSVRLLCIGRLVDLKRYDILIDSMKILRQEYPDIILSIAGSGPQEKVLKKRVDDLGLNSCVKLLGHISETDMLYQKADIFLISSDTEGSPITLLEAMAFSLPIVATSVGAIPEMVRDGTDAILIPPNNVSKMVESVRLLIVNRDYTLSLGISARQRYAKDFTSDVMAQAYHQKYKSVFKR